MPPRPTVTSGFGARERLPAVPADSRDDPHDLIHLLDRQQPAERAAVSGLAAALPSGRERLRTRRRMGWIRGRGLRRIRRVLAEPSFQLTDPLALRHDQRLGGVRRRFPNLQRQGQGGPFHRPGYRGSPPVLQPPVTRGLNAYQSVMRWGIRRDQSAGRQPSQMTERWPQHVPVTRWELRAIADQVRDYRDLRGRTISLSFEGAFNHWLLSMILE
jgi:hypothetical protein